MEVAQNGAGSIPIEIQILCSSIQLLVVLLNTLKIKLIVFIQSYYFIISFYKNAEHRNAMYLERLKLEYISLLN